MDEKSQVKDDKTQAKDEKTDFDENDGMHGALFGCGQCLLM